MKILVVSGFLGSGKTTFINQIMKYRKDEYIILENEYASVNVDSDLLENDREKIWEMTQGCICCNIKKDLSETVLTISNTYKPNVLLIEPTGLGKLSNILRSIKRISYENIKILPAITLVDASVFLKNFKEKDENFLDQILYAKTIVVTKTETLSPEEKLGIQGKIKTINPNASCFNIDEINQDESFYERLLKEDEFDFELPNKSIDKFQDYMELSFTEIAEDSIERFLLKLNLVLRGIFGEIYRIKGFLPINEQWTKVDSVGIQYSLETIDEKKVSKLVFIGKNLNKAYLEDLFVKDKLP